jgi:hypothetical protein
MTRHDRNHHQRSSRGIAAGCYDRLGAGRRQCNRHWACRRRPGTGAAKARHHTWHCCCDRSSNHIGNHSNAVAAGTGASACGRNSSPLGLLEDVARAARGIARPAGSGRSGRDVGRLRPQGRRQSGERLRRKSFSQAALQIVVADVSMSLDNVLAVAGAAREHPFILAFGLLLSVTLMGIGANVVGRLLQKHRWMVILYVACEMIYRGAHELKPVIGAIGLIYS